jgi:hypothetical protein
VPRTARAGVLFARARGVRGRTALIVWVGLMWCDERGQSMAGPAVLLVFRS